MKLKPCPFCGSRATIDVQKWTNPDSYQARAYCTNGAECGADIGTVELRRVNAINGVTLAWNRRVLRGAPPV